MKTCEDCGCRVYEHGCVNCNEVAYIEAQDGCAPSAVNCPMCGEPWNFVQCQTCGWQEPKR